MAGINKNSSLPNNNIIPPIVWILFLLIGFGIGKVTQSSSLTLLIVIWSFVIIMALLLIARPIYITYLLIFTFPFLSTLPRGLLPVPLKIDELLIVFGLIAFVISPSKSKQLMFTKIDLVFVGLVATGAILPIVGTLMRNTQPDWLNVIALVKPYLLYRLVVMTIDTRPKLLRALSLLLLPTTLVSVIALLQLLDIGNMQSHLAKIYYDTPAVQVMTRNLTGLSSFLRATSTLGNWNALGSYSALAAFLGFSLWRSKSNLQFKILPGLSLVSSIASLILAGSSSSFVGFITGGLTVFLGGLRRYRLRKNQLIGATLLLLLLVIVFLTIGSDVVQAQIKRQSIPHIYDRASEQYYPTHGFPASVVVRWYLARHLFSLIVEDKIALLTGFGENDYSIGLLPWGTAESGYVGMLFFYGPLYVIFYFIFMFTVLFYSWRLGKIFILHDETLYALTLSLNAMVFAMVVMNLISSYYSAAGTSHIFIITSALMMSSLGNQKKMCIVNEHKNDAAIAKSI